MTLKSILNTELFHKQWYTTDHNPREDRGTLRSNVCVCAICNDFNTKSYPVNLNKNAQSCSGLIKTAMNNVVLPILFNVVNNVGNKTLFDAVAKPA